MDAFILSVLFMPLFAIQCDDSRQLDAKHRQLEFAWEHWEFYGELFEDASKKRLELLSKHKNDSIANHSAWQLVRFPVLVGPDEYRVTQTDEKRLQWFLRFFEERNRIPIPHWWKTGILRSRDTVIHGPAEKPLKDVSPGKPSKQPYNKPKDYSSDEWRYPKNATVTVKDGVIKYVEEQNEIELPKDLFDQSDFNIAMSTNISCTFTQSNCLVAIHSDMGSPHLVACIDRLTNSITWKAEACGCHVLGGIMESWVSLVATIDGRLFCFGSSSCGGIYVHEFDVSTGKTLMQFSNNY